jgi:ankyrin repeat protein
MIKYFINVIMDLINATLTIDIDIKKIKKIIKEGLVDINKQDGLGNTALYIASAHGRLEIVRVLLKSGADPNIKRYDGYSSLIWPVVSGNSKIVRVLLEYGADPKTHLLSVARNYHVKTTKILLQYGADITIKYNNKTPLKQAINHDPYYLQRPYKDRNKIIELFIRHIVITPMLHKRFTRINENVVRETLNYI